MSDDQTPEAEPAPESAGGESMTPGGYSYTVIDDSDGDSMESALGSHRPARMIGLIAATAIVPAVIVGAIVWFVAPGGSGGGGSRTEADVSNVVSAFSQGQGENVSIRYEGELPPGIPDVPAYPGAKVVSSTMQFRGDDAGYLVIYDTNDSRAKVGSYFEEKFKADPWQIDAGQDGRESTLHQFSKIDDPDITGLVLVSESKDGKTTTIVESLQVVSGAKGKTKPPFAPGEARTLPAGFPDKLPAYTDALLIEAAFQKQSGASQFAVSWVTKESASAVLDFYRGKLGDAGLTVTDGDASSSSLEDAETIQFADANQELTGVVTTGKFGDDASYTRIDLQTQVAKSP